jgi:hypothetical protein
MDFSQLSKENHDV